MRRKHVGVRVVGFKEERIQEIKEPNLVKLSQRLLTIEALKSRTIKHIYQGPHQQT